MSVRSGVVAACMVGSVGLAWAQNTVTITGVGPHQYLRFTSPVPGAYYAGELLLTVVTPTNTYANCPAWCVDFYTALNSPFTASNAAPTGATYLAVSYLAHQFELAYAPTDLTDTAAVTAAATQLAMWELLDPAHTYTVDKDYNNANDLPAVQSLASALVAEAAGKRPLLGLGPVAFTVQTTAGASNKLVNVLVTLTESSQAVVGENIILQTSEGTFISPASGTIITTVSDTNGQAQAVVDLGTNTAPLTVFAFAYATPLGIFLPDQAGVQTLLGTLGQVPYTASSDFTPSVQTCACGNPSLGAASAYGVLQLGGGTVSITLGGVGGDVAVGPKGKFSISGSSFVSGTLYLSTNDTFSQSGSSTIGAVVKNVDLSAAINNALITSLADAALTPTQAFTTWNSTMTVTGTAGTNVIKVGSVNLQAGDYVTLTGPAGAVFIINVPGAFSMSGGSTIRAAGGVAPQEVIYNITGTSGNISLGGGSGVDGTLLAPHRPVSLSVGKTSGQVISGGNITISSGATVTCPCP